LAPSARVPTFRDMNAIELLRSQHKQVRKLFTAVEAAEDLDARHDAFLELANTLAAHAVMEERLFYPAAWGDKSEEILREAAEEHLALKRVLADLLDMDPGHPNFAAKLYVMREQFEHHVQEEESEIFKAARRELDRGEIEQLGAKMKRLFDREMRGEPSAVIPGQTHEAAALP
jgi:hemerythrin superfamily protein